MPLTEEDFLMETEVQEKVEEAILGAFEDGWHVDLEGKAGAGKTSIAREMALLLGLPRTVFQMHGERDISDWIGTYREDSRGRIILSCRSWIDKSGKKRYRQPLLDYLVNGGVFVSDEGAIGEQGRELMSWLSAIVARDKEIYISEFPGHLIKLEVHKDFHLIVTNNSPEEAQGRHFLKSEIASNLHFIHVDEDESPETLKRLFIHFLGKKSPLSSGMKENLAEILVNFHLDLKPRIGKEVGKDNRDRHTISKREIRRIAARIRKELKTNNPDEALYSLYKAMRVVYKAMFPDTEERMRVLELLHSQLQGAVIAISKKDGTFGPTMRSWISGGEDWSAMQVNVLKYRLQREVSEKFGGAVTDHEAWVSYFTQSLFEQGEPLLYISQQGARTGDMLHSVAVKMNAKIVPIDSAPEHTLLEILGDLFPILGKRPEDGTRSQHVKGAVSRHLMMDSGSRRNDGEGKGNDIQNSENGETQQPVIVWIRNIDQWSEEMRTALNGFLEDGYIDLEVREGEIRRFVKPAHVHFVSEIASDSQGDFSSAFFNRWVKLGVSSDSPFEEKENQISDFEKVLKKEYDLDSKEARILTRLYRGILMAEAEHLWANMRQYKVGPTIFYALAEAISQSKKEDPRWRKLMQEIARTGYDPRSHYSQGPPQKENDKFV
ncbi:MAG: hypothetical protein HYY63_03880, partial [Elusimicrobia bacterium]|nr:hypothetical protein [Elusimicrobiota bacterium]